LGLFFGILAGFREINRSFHGILTKKGLGRRPEGGVGAAGLTPNHY